MGSCSGAISAVDRVRAARAGGHARDCVDARCLTATRRCPDQTGRLPAAYGQAVHRTDLVEVGRRPLDRCPSTETGHLAVGTHCSSSASLAEDFNGCSQLWDQRAKSSSSVRAAEPTAPGWQLMPDWTERKALLSVEEVEARINWSATPRDLGSAASDGRKAIVVEGSGPSDHRFVAVVVFGRWSRRVRQNLDRTAVVSK